MNGILCCDCHSINNSHDTQTWGNMAGVKSNILRRWDSADVGVRICCIKFVQRVVQLQTPGVVADPRVRYEAYLKSMGIDIPASVQI